MRRRLLMAGLLAHGSPSIVAFPGHPSGIMTNDSPLTVAGAAAALNRVPFQSPLGEPSAPASLNREDAASRAMTGLTGLALRHTLCIALGPTIGPYGRCAAVRPLQVGGTRPAAQAHQKLVDEDDACASSILIHWRPIAVLISRSKPWNLPRGTAFSDC